MIKFNVKFRELCFLIILYYYTDFSFLFWTDNITCSSCNSYSTQQILLQILLVFHTNQAFF